MSQQVGRILVVDDEVGILRVMERILKKTNQVTVALGGELAWEFLSQDQEYDAIICDLNMDGLSGMELYQRVEENFPQLTERFVFVTGGAFTPKSESFLKTITNPHYNKPLDLTRFRQSVEGRILKMRGEVEETDQVS